MQFPITRMRRLRKNAKIRNIVRETKLEKDDLIYPIYFKEELEGDQKEEISSLPGEFRYSLDSGVEFAKQLEAKGLKSIIVFGIPKEDTKDEIATPDYSSTGIVQKAVRRLKKETDLVVITDVCLCQYTSHGHCGMIVENEDTDDGIEILNDESLPYIAKVALSHAQAGADIVAPSDMMDGRVGAIRQILDENGYFNVMIMSYSAKYAADVLKKDVLKIDSGLYVESLKGFPGPYTHYCDDTITEDGLLKLMEGIKDRTAEFREALAYCKYGEEPVVFSSVTKGRIALKKSGKYGYSWDFIFIPQGKRKTLGNFDDKERFELYY